MSLQILLPESYILRSVSVTVLGDRDMNNQWQFITKDFKYPSRDR
jgi:hypothetical protein